MTSPDSDTVAVSKAINRRTGKNFYLATRLFPARIRRATHALYGFFRVADEVVDDPGDATPEEQRAELDRIRAAALGERDTDDPVLSAFRDVAEANDIDDREVEEFIDAMAMDASVDRYETYADLEGYLRGSSVAVAFMMLDVMGSDGALTETERERAEPHAKALGEAFQLTNFIRDVREDMVEYDRIYLPLATLERFGVEESEIEALAPSERFAAAVRHELRRTERLYREGVEGIQHLPADCQFPVLLAAVLYAEHHRLIRGQGYDTLSSRPTLSTFDRLSVAARTWVHWKRLGDPVATFERVSAVPTTERTEPGPVGEPPASGGRSKGPIRRLSRFLP
jgi:phytoene synthase